MPIKCPGELVFCTPQLDVPFDLLLKCSGAGWLRRRSQDFFIYLARFFDSRSEYGLIVHLANHDRQWHWLLRSDFEELAKGLHWVKKSSEESELHTLWDCVWEMRSQSSHPFLPISAAAYTNERLLSVRTRVRERRFDDYQTAKRMRVTSPVPWPCTANDASGVHTDQYQTKVIPLMFILPLGPSTPRAPPAVPMWRN